MTDTLQNITIWWHFLDITLPLSFEPCAVCYLVDTSEVPDFNTMYELYDPCTVMFFFRNKHIMVRPDFSNHYT